MKKNTPILALLGALLLIGLCVAGWIILNPPTSGGTTISGTDGADPCGAGADGADPLTMDAGTDDADSTDDGREGPGDGTEDGSDPGTDGSDGETDGATPNDGGEVIEPVVEPGEEWVAKTHEFTVTGVVRYKTDGGTVAGASVKVQRGQDEVWNFGRRITPDSEVGAKFEPPQTKFSGSTTTNGAGEYTLLVKATTYVHRDSTDHAGDQPNEDKSVENGPTVTSFGSGWSGQFVVVATLTGYAPAHSRAVGGWEESPVEINLKLAVPAVLTGRVIDGSTGEGISGASGQLQDNEAWDDGGSNRFFTTDENGYFTIDDMPASSWTLTVSAAGYATYNGWENAGRIRLQGGQQNDLGDIAMLKAASVTGRVLQEQSNEPVEGAEVSLRSGGGRFGGWTQHSAQTDAEGRYTIEGVSPGAFALVVRAEGYAKLEQEGKSVTAGGENDFGDVFLNQGLSIFGTVTNSAAAGIPGAQIQIFENNGGAFWEGRGETLASGTSDAEGAFTISGLPEDTLSIEVTVEGYARHNQTVKVSGATRVDITMVVGGSIAGRLLDAKGTPVSGAAVTAHSHDSQTYSMWKIQPSAVGWMASGANEQATTGEDGRFEIKNVPEDTYLIIVASAVTEESPGMVSLTKDHVAVKNERRTDVGDLRFLANGSARITVTEDGQPVPDLEVSLAQGMGWGGGDNEKVTGADGVVFIEDIPAGTYFVRTQRDEGGFDTEAMQNRRITVKPEETVEFTLELRPKDGVHLHGRLTMNGEAIFTDITLVGQGDREGVIKNVEPQEGGFYEILNVKTGTYILHARESDAAVTATAKLVLKEEGDFPFTHDFSGFVISGSVSTPENTPEQFTSVSVTIARTDGDDGQFSQWLKGRTQAGAAGAFQFTNVTSGNYKVTASLDGIGSASTSISVGGSDISGLSLSIVNNSGTIKLVVSKLNGTPVGSGGFATVELLDANGEVVDMGEAFEGWFMITEGVAVTIPTVPPGNYSLIIRGSGYIKQSLEGVTVNEGETTDADIELTAAAELRMSVTNPEVTQQMLDAATVRYFDAGGNELERESNAFDSFGGATETFETPTLRCRYIGENVAEVRIKLEGYTEVVIAVAPTPGLKIEKQQTLIAG